MYTTHHDNQQSESHRFYFLTDGTAMTDDGVPLKLEDFLYWNRQGTTHWILSSTHKEFQ